jgi:hypothetical protein
MKPSDTKKDSTPQHDDIHLWLHDIENQNKLTDFVIGRKGVFPADVIEKHTEYPIYGYKNFLLGIIDCILHVRTKNDHYYLLCEIKPKLDSISSTLEQIRIYKDQITSIECRRNLGISYDATICPVILTYDKNRKYDVLLNGEEIKVFVCISSI